MQQSLCLVFCLAQRIATVFCPVVFAHNIKRFYGFLLSLMLYVLSTITTHVVYFVLDFCVELPAAPGQDQQKGNWWERSASIGAVCLALVILYSLSTLLK